MSKLTVNHEDFTASVTGPGDGEVQIKPDDHLPITQIIIALAREGVDYRTTITLTYGQLRSLAACLHALSYDPDEKE